MKSSEGRLTSAGTRIGTRAGTICSPLAGLSLREVAKRVGVSHAAPYRHFRDKQTLLQAIAQEGFVAHGFCMLAIESHLHGVSREGESVEDLRSAIHANLMRTLLAD